jgi:hypothetical protein
MGRASFLLVALLALPANAFAFECTLDKNSCLVAPRWASRVVPYTIEAPPANSPVDLETFRRAVRASFDRWADPSCTDLVIEEQPASNNVIRIVTQNWGLLSHRAAFTHLSFNGVTGSISKATIDVNFEHHLFSADSCVSGALDLEAVLTHEAGHYIGLAHPCEYPAEELGMSAEGDELPPCPKESCDSLLTRIDDPMNTILWPTAMSCENSFRELGPDDVEGVCSIYPRGADPLPCATLPLQEDPYVANQAFGCSSTATAGGLDLSALILLAGLCVLRRRR